MRDCLSWFPPLLFLLLLTACGREQPKLAPLPQEAVIMAFGDSLTYGAGAGREENYPVVLAGLTTRRVINAGIPGEISADGLARLPSLLYEHRPQLLVLVHGGNDMLRKISASETRANLSEMIRLARSRGIPVVMLGVPRPGLFLSSAEFYQSVAEETGTPIDSEILADILANRDLKADPIHPNAQGYALMADTIYRMLREADALSPR
ncbi:MAG: arylesterase [Pseudomonadota bacterium]